MPLMILPSGFNAFDFHRMSLGRGQHFFIRKKIYTGKNKMTYVMCFMFLASLVFRILSFLLSITTSLSLRFMIILSQPNTQPSCLFSENTNLDYTTINFTGFYSQLWNDFSDKHFWLFSVIFSL